MTTGEPIVDARWSTRLVILVLLLCGFYGSYRAFHLALVNDEVGLLESIRQNSYAKLLLGADKDSNLQFLATLLAKPCVELLPLNEITAARVPSLLGLALFLWGVWRIGLEFPVAMRFPITLALVSNAFLLDFFSLARGYGLALGFTMLSLSFLSKAVTRPASRCAAPALWMAAFAVLSNAGFLYFFAATILATAWLAWRQRIWVHTVTTTGMLGLFFASRLTQSGASKLLWYHVRHYSDNLNGLRNNFVYDTIGSLIRCTFYDRSPDQGLLRLFSVGLALLICLLACWSYRERIRVGFVLSVVAISVAALCTVANVLCGAKYPVERVALYLVPVVMLIIGAVAAWSRLRWLRFYLWGLLLAITGIGLQGINLDHTQTWRECADIPSALLALREVHKQTGRAVILAISGSKWTVWYYAEHLLGLHPEPSQRSMAYLRNYDWLTAYEWRALQTRCDFPAADPLLPGTTHLLLSLLDQDDRRLLGTPLPGGLTQVHFYPASDTTLQMLIAPHHQGTMTFPNGEKYVGGFKRGMKSGRGTYTWPDGQTYEGEFKNDKANGRGRGTWPDGRTYAGEYKDGLANGQGSATWTDGRRYVGGFRDGQPDGVGKMTYPDGRVEDGLWKQGRFAGPAP